MSIYSDQLDPVPALKAQLAEVLVTLIDGYSALQASAFIGLPRQRIGALRAGQLDDFSLQRLVRVLHRLGARIGVHVTPAHEARHEEMREEHARRTALIVADRERRRQLAERRRAARRQRIAAPPDATPRSPESLPSSDR